MERKIDAPDSDHCTDEEAARFLGVKVSTFNTLVDKGLIRGGRKWTHRLRKWPWKAVVIFSWEVELGLIDPKILPEGSEE